MFRALAKGIPLALLTAAFVAGAIPSRAADDFKPEEGFVSLFNGKDLTGWVYKPKAKDSLEGKTETPDKRIEVKDGAIIMHDVGKMDIKDLFTTKDFDKPFILRMQFKAAAKADSGVYIRGPQLQIRDFIRRGEQKHLKNFKNDDWNDLEITVGPVTSQGKVNGKALEPKDVFELSFKDGKPTAKLNGADVAVTQYQFTPATCFSVNKVNGEEIEKGFTVGVKGPIGLQAETGQFEFRRVRIKELPQ